MHFAAVAVVLAFFINNFYYYYYRWVPLKADFWEHENLSGIRYSAYPVIYSLLYMEKFPWQKSSLTRNLAQLMYGLSWDPPILWVCSLSFQVFAVTHVSLGVIPIPRTHRVGMSCPAT